MGNQISSTTDSANRQEEKPPAMSDKIVSYKGLLTSINGMLSSDRDSSSPLSSSSSIPPFIVTSNGSSNKSSDSSFSTTPPRCIPMLLGVVVPDGIHNERLPTNDLFVNKVTFNKDGIVNDVQCNKTKNDDICMQEEIVDDDDMIQHKTKRTSASQKGITKHKPNVTGNHTVVKTKSKQSYNWIRKTNSQNLVQTIDTTTDASSCYSFQEFMQLLHAVEIEWGKTLEDIDESKYFNRNCNVHRTESLTQLRALYGRIECDTLQDIFNRILNLQPNDIFIDLGHGIGITNLQVAYTFGCESRGIELIYHRYIESIGLQQALENKMNDFNKLHHRIVTLGNVSLIQGRIEDPKNRDFIIRPPPLYKKVIGTFQNTLKVFVNNFDNAFGSKVSKSCSTVSLDSYVAGLFALMVPGSVMVTLFKLPLPPSKQEVDEQRTKHGLPVGGKNSSFYNVETESLGLAKGKVSWAKQRCNDELIVWKYTRLEQESLIPVFLCSNQYCSNATDSIPNLATRTNRLSNIDEEEVIIETRCSKCFIIQKNLRQHSKSIFYGKKKH